VKICIILYSRNIRKTRCTGKFGGAILYFFREIEYNNTGVACAGEKAMTGIREDEGKERSNVNA
jgi:hypothetical protein